MRYAIEHLEPNPHMKVRNGNSNAFVPNIIKRWKQLYILTGYKKKTAEVVFAAFLETIPKHMHNNYRLYSCF